MARFLDSMKQAENGNRQPPPAEPELRLDAPAEIPFTLHVAPAPVSEFVDDSGITPFIEVGPSRSFEASPDVLAQRSPPTVRLVRPASESRSVTFRPASRGASAPSGIASEIVAFHDPDHHISAQYRELLSQILGSVTTSTSPALLFTGSVASAGTTTVTLNIAATAARQGQRVIVVDVNTRRPAVAGRLALCDRPGLGEVLAGAATLDEAVQETQQPGLSALTIGGPAASAPRGAESYRSLFRQLRQRFDLVLVDAPRWDARADVTAPGAACDLAFLVVPAGSEDSPAVTELTVNIPASGVRLAGSVVAAR
jgi:Mrp family chromosome partitioning ATPase